MKLAVGFVTYNEASAKYLADFLPSLERALAFLKTEDREVYAFDNSSPAYRANHAAISDFNSHHKKPIRLLTLGRNLGFARAYNILIDTAVQEKAKYFLIINPDTLLKEDSIRRLVEALDQDGSLGSVSPKVLRWDFSGKKETDTIDTLGIVLEPGLSFLDLGQGEKDDGRHDKSMILGPSGAAGLYRISALKKVAELGMTSRGCYYDERFFMYKEDCDLAYRLFLAGYGSELVPEAVIYHDRTASSSGRSFWAKLKARSAKSRQIRSWSFRNQHLLYLKHWKEQNIVNRILIIFRVVEMLIFSFILEQFLLIEYGRTLRAYRGLTDIK